VNEDFEGAQKNIEQNQNIMKLFIYLFSSIQPQM